MQPEQISLVCLISIMCLSNATVSLCQTNPPNWSASTTSPCRYVTTSHGLKVDCTHRGLASVPDYLPDDVISLDLTGNMIKVLQKNSFERLPHLMNLTLSGNGMRKIEEGTFHSLGKLQQIFFRNNKLTSLSKGVFCSNSILRIVDLSINHLSAFNGNDLCSNSVDVLLLKSNNISVLNFTGFEGNTISTLSFDRNPVSTFHAEDFLPLTNTTIDQLTFTQTGLKSLPDSVFRYLKRVTNISLSRNHIDTFNLRSFLGMTSLHKLDLSINKIQSIIPYCLDENTTSQLPPLQQLYMYSNSIRTIPSGAFRGLDRLVKLDIHQCGISHLVNDSFIGLTSLEILDIRSNSIKFLQNEMFIVLPKLQKLFLPGIELNVFMPSQFKKIKTLTILDVSRNHITEIKTGNWELQSLQTLDLSYNSIRRITKNSFEGMVNLRVLVLSNNRLLTSISNDAFYSCNKLDILYLSSIPSLGSLTSPFMNLKQLTRLYFTNTGIALTLPIFTGLDSLQRLYLRNSGQTSNSLWDLKNNISILSTLPSIKWLFLSENQLDDLPPGTFRGLSKLKTLEMKKCNIKKLNQNVFQNLTSLWNLYLDDNIIQSILPGHLSHLASLRMFSLNSNALKEIPRKLFEKNTQLRNTYLAQNHLTVIEDGTIMPMGRIDLSTNPWACTCQLKFFVDWLYRSNVSLINPNQTLCSHASFLQFRNKTLLTFQPDLLCEPNIMVYVFLSFAFFLGLVGSLFLYRKRWWINYKCFHLKLLVIGYKVVKDGRERLDYEHDINMMFDDDDERWVRTIFKVGLEEKVPDLNRIVCGDDDLPLGMYYIDAIIESIEASYKTILFVSPSAVNNHTFINKIRLAFQHMNEVEIENVIVIFTEDLPNRELPYLIRLFLSKNKPYFLWTEDNYGKRLFWDKVAQELKDNRKMNDKLPV